MIKVNNKFWMNYAKKLCWQNFPRKYFKSTNNKPRWFFDGKINVYFNCISRHIKNGNGDKPAIYFFESSGKHQKFSYKEIDNLVDKFSSFLMKKSIKKNTKIMIHASASLNTSVAILTCAKLGIHFSVVFKELKKDALVKRISLFKPNILISDKKKYKYIKNSKIKILGLSNYLKYESLKNQKIKFFNSTRPLFTLFTSGSTGMPKGITHGSGGYLLYAYYTSEKYFGLSSKSIMLTASDAGWINGHTYALFGPLSIGATTVIVEKPIMLLNKMNLVNILKIGTTILYMPVTLIRLMKSVYKNTTFNSKSLKILGSMGEPMANSVGRWFSKKFNLKNKPIINTYFQTETGGIISSHKYNQLIKPEFYGYVGYPNKTQLILNKLSKDKKELKILNSWPGQMINVINSRKQWNNYFDINKNFRLFDYASIKNKNIFIHGRTDDVINIRGHRIGSSELEATVLEIKSIIECSAIAIEDKMQGNKIYLFCISKNNDHYNEKILIEKKIVKNFGIFAIPKKIFFVNELPKTRSGKIMRRILRELIINKNNKFNNKLSSDISTLINKNALNEIAKEINN
jgi:acetyl-CoA synthetase